MSPKKLTVQQIAEIKEDHAKNMKAMRNADRRKYATPAETEYDKAVYPERHTGTGSRVQVMNGTKFKTGGGLTKSDLMYNKFGRIVSKKKSITAKKDKRLKDYPALKGPNNFGHMDPQGNICHPKSNGKKKKIGIKGEICTASTVASPRRSPRATGMLSKGSIVIKK